MPPVDGDRSARRVSHEQIPVEQVDGLAIVERRAAASGGLVEGVQLVEADGFGHGQSLADRGEHQA